MIAWIREELKLRKWDRKAQEIRASYAEEIRKLDAAKDWNGRNGIISLSAFEASEYEDEAATIRSNRIVRRALRLSLPVPPKVEDSGQWWQSQTYGTWALTNVGTYELRRAIRIEEKERREVWLAWGGMLVSVLSLVVAIIALLKS